MLRLCPSIAFRYDVICFLMSERLFVRTCAAQRVILVNDHDDMIVKALSWALRALVIHDAQAVSHFLDTHEDELAARIKREVRNKLETGLKNP